MSTTENTGQPRMLTNEELALCIKLCRESRKWSQETLAELAGITVRTIQRVENGQGASADTRRALASAFGATDLDGFNKPQTFLSEEEIKAEKEKLDRDYVTLAAHPLTSGKELARLAASCTGDVSDATFELSREADETFAALLDYFRDYRDCADEFSQVQKLEVYDELQSYINALKKFGVSLCFAERTMQWKTEPKGEFSVAYLFAFPLAKEPEKFYVPKLMPGLGFH